MAKCVVHAALPETVEAQDLPEMVFLKAPPLGPTWKVAKDRLSFWVNRPALLAPPWNADRN